jgi:hypothetical protein
LNNDQDFVSQLGGGSLAQLGNRQPIRWCLGGAKEYKIYKNVGMFPNSWSHITYCVGNLSDAQVLLVIVLNQSHDTLTNMRLGFFPFKLDKTPEMW